MPLSGIGFGEMLMIAMLVLIVFGPRRLPEITRSMGKAIREFKRGMNEIQRELEVADRQERWKRPADPAHSASTATGGAAASTAGAAASTAGAAARAGAPRAAGAGSGEGSEQGPDGSESDGSDPDGSASAGSAAGRPDADAARSASDARSAAASEPIIAPPALGSDLEEWTREPVREPVPRETGDGRGESDPAEQRHLFADEAPADDED